MDLIDDNGAIRRIAVLLPAIHCIHKVKPTGGPACVVFIEQILSQKFCVDVPEDEIRAPTKK
jgi:hypothetical protein